MRPPMRQSVRISSKHVDVSRETEITYDDYGMPVSNQVYDDYGIPERSAVTSKARVRRKGNLIQSADNSQTNTNIEIDVPRDIMVSVGDVVDYIDMDGARGTGTVVDYEDATNVSGSRVLFRTVFVDGR